MWSGRVIWTVAMLCGSACSDPARDVLFDFESGTADGWTLTRGDLPPQPTASTRARFNKHGSYFLGTGERPDGTVHNAAAGALRSPTFTINRSYVVLRFGGGNHAKYANVALRSATTGRMLQTATGYDSDHMRTLIWDVEQLRSTDVYLEVVDQLEGEWGHVNLDYVRLVDE